MIPCFSVKMRTTKKKIIMSSKGPDTERLDFMDTVFKGEEGQRGGPYFCGPSGSLLSGFSLSFLELQVKDMNTLFSVVLFQSCLCGTLLQRHEERPEQVNFCGSLGSGFLGCTQKARRKI